MTSRTMRILNIISGILLIAAGIYCLCNQDVAAMSAGIILGLFMLASGVVMIVIYSGTRRFILGAGWLLLDGIITVIFSLFLLTNQWLSMMSLPFLSAWAIAPRAQQMHRVPSGCTETLSTCSRPRQRAR